MTEKEKILLEQFNPVTIQDDMMFGTVLGNHPWDKDPEDRVPREAEDRNLSDQCEIDPDGRVHRGRGANGL